MAPMRWLDFVPCIGRGPERVLGVFVSAEALFLTELEPAPDGAGFLVRQTREERWRGADAPWENAAAFSEQMMRLCMTYGLPHDKVSLCLPRELAFVYERAFPVMERSDLETAVRWDIETNVPFAEGGYWAGFGRHEERLELAALPTEYGRKLVEAMTEAGLGVIGVTMAPLQFSHRREENRILWRETTVKLPEAAVREPWNWERSMALYAALRRYYPAVGIEFLPMEEREERIRLWRLAGNFVVACTLIVVSLLFVRNVWLLSKADAQAEALRQEYALDLRERDAMTEFARGKAALSDTEKSLQALSEERRSWYALLSALGTVGVDGVYLTEIDVQEDGAILCGGRAMDHGRLVAYLEQLGRETVPLLEQPELKESATDARGELRFKLRLRF